VRQRTWVASMRLKHSDMLAVNARR
jgi:hypothetical protein